MDINNILVSRDTTGIILNGGAKVVPLHRDKSGNLYVAPYTRAWHFDLCYVPQDVTVVMNVASVGRTCVHDIHCYSGDIYHVGDVRTLDASKSINVQGTGTSLRRGIRRKLILNRDLILPTKDSVNYHRAMFYNCPDYINRKLFVVTVVNAWNVSFNSCFSDDFIYSAVPCESVYGMNVFAKSNGAKIIAKDVRLTHNPFSNELVDARVVFADFKFKKPSTRKKNHVWYSIKGTYASGSELLVGGIALGAVCYGIKQVDYLEGARKWRDIEKARYHCDVCNREFSLGGKLTYSLIMWRDDAVKEGYSDVV